MNKDNRPECRGEREERQLFDRPFNEYWGDKGEKWNGKLDIKNYSSEVWEAARKHYMNKGIFEPDDLVQRIKVALNTKSLEERMLGEWDLTEVLGIIKNHYCNSLLCEPVKDGNNE